MTSDLIFQLAGAGALLLVLWTLFRFAMGLRWEKVQREETRQAEEASGRRVVAELPLAEAVVLFVEDAEAFRWGDGEARKADLAGARLRLNGAVVSTAARAGTTLADPALVPEELEGRETWDVRLHLAGGRTIDVPCGRLREGVSREAATRVFEAVKRALG